jgi:hypothetical protein
MVSTKANRAAFISSVKEYMDTFGFSGVDLDWEYPGAPERGGNKLADTRNLSLLVKEMRAAYGQSYGISVTLAPDYWYLRWFDAKAMEPNVDFFGFMAYGNTRFLVQFRHIANICQIFMGLGTRMSKHLVRKFAARLTYVKSPTIQCHSGSMGLTPRN